MQLLYTYNEDRKKNKSYFKEEKKKYRHNILKN